MGIDFNKFKNVFGKKISIRPVRPLVRPSILSSLRLIVALLAVALT